MRNYRQELAAIPDEAVELSRRHGIEGELVRDQAQIAADLAKYRPELMVYGCYNAGKSTLLNALLSETGEELAPVSAAPCTSAVTTYCFGDYTVYDTPGIDAPIEHERVSRAHLDRCHVVAFVVSTSGSFDEESIVGEVYRVLEQGKKLIVVLNDKQGFDPGSREVAEIREQLLVHLRRLSGDAQIERRFDLVWVSAKAALEARRSGRPRRYEASGVQALEELMLRRLVETGEVELLRVPAAAIERGLVELEAKLEELAADDGLVVLRELQDRQNAVRRGFLAVVETDLKPLRGRLVRDVEAAILVDRGEVGVGAAIEDYLGLVEGIVRRRYEAALEELGRFVEDAGAKLRLDQCCTLERDWERLSMDVTEGSSDWLPKIDARKLSELIQSPEGVELIKEGLLKLREWKVPLFKRRWERTLGRWAKNAAKGLGVFVEVAVAVVGWRAAAKEQEKAERAEAERRRAIRDLAEKVALQVEQDVLRELPGVARELFRVFDENASRDASRESERVEAAQEGLADARELLERLAEVVDELRVGPAQVDSDERSVAVG